MHTQEKSYLHLAYLGVSRYVSAWFWALGLSLTQKLNLTPFILVGQYEYKKSPNS